MKRKHLILAAAATAVAALAGGVAWAAIPDGAGVYTACKLNATGTIRLIDPSLPTTSLLQHCTSIETPISWNQKGQKGDTGPVGPIGPTGPKGDTGAKGEAGATGADGPAGPAGADGANGADGAPGAQGPPGPTGQQGQAGPQGSTGPAGPAGPPGPPSAPSLPPAFRSTTSVATLAQGFHVPFTPVMTKALPAGTYVLWYRINVGNDNNFFAQDNSRIVSCEASPNGDGDGFSETVGGNSDFDFAWTTTISLAAPGDVTVSCVVLASEPPPGTPTHVSAEAWVTAIRVSGIS